MASPGWQGRLLVIGWLGSCGAFLFSWAYAAQGQGAPQGVMYWTAFAVPLYLLTVWWYRTQGLRVRSWVVYGSVMAWLYFAKRMFWATFAYDPRPLSSGLELYAVVLPPTLALTAVFLVGRRLVAAERAGIAQDDA